MEEIFEMKTSEKILLLNYIKSNYSRLKKHWDTEKIIMLEDLIVSELLDLGFNFKN